MTRFLSPKSLVSQDEIEGFSCGHESLDDWLYNRALGNQQTGASRTMICKTDANEVAGFYSLSSYSLARELAGSTLGRGMPNPIPCILIGRLAVDLKFAGQGLGGSLLQHALLKAAEAAEIIGSRAVVVHALNDSAAEFYRHFGFKSLPGQDDTLFMLLSSIRATVTAST